MDLRFCYEWPQHKILVIFLYTEEICNRYFVSLKVNKIEAFIPQTIWPYLLPYLFSILFCLFETYRDEVCSCFKCYTFLFVTFLKHTMYKHVLIWGGSAYLFSLDGFYCLYLCLDDLIWVLLQPSAKCYLKLSAVRNMFKYTQRMMCSFLELSSNSLICTNKMKLLPCSYSSQIIHSLNYSIHFCLSIYQ